MLDDFFYMYGNVLMGAGVATAICGHETAGYIMAGVSLLFLFVWRLRTLGYFRSRVRSIGRSRSK